MKRYVILSGIVGGIVGSIMTALLVSSGTAESDKFGDIECTSLRVVDVDGNPRVSLSIDEHHEQGGRVYVVSKDGGKSVVISIDAAGGYVGASGKYGESGAVLSINPHGGDVSTFGKDGKLSASLGIGKYGGQVTAFKTVYKDGEYKEFKEAKLGIHEHGGVVVVKGKGKGTAVMGISEYGGIVVAGDKNEKSLASVGISEFGGEVYTKDKFGNEKFLD